MKITFSALLTFIATARHNLVFQLIILTYLEKLCGGA